MVEYLGSGMPRILKAYPRENFTFAPQFIRLSMPMSKGAKVTGQVTALIHVLHGAMSRKELMAALELTGRDNFEKLYLRPALAEGYVEMTLPEKPNSRLQQYRLTGKGQQTATAIKKDQ